MTNGREIRQLEREIDLVDWLSMKTPDFEAQNKYFDKINELQYMHHRLAGKWYRRESGKE